MNNDLIHSDATKLAALISSGEVSPVEVMQAHLDRIEAANPKLNAIVTLAPDALRHAKEAERAVQQGDKLAPLHGVPFTVKDSIDTAGVPTQRGSPIFKGRIPNTDATVVARIKAAGGILLAKTNLPEFSYAAETDNLLTGRTNNPWNLDRTPGGSSGGESAALAAGLSPLGLGSDLSISLRGPAAMTGVAALKATHGRVPMTGLWPRVPRRFWHVGPMARSVRDIALAYSLLAGPDGEDGFSIAPVALDSGIGPSPTRPPRVGVLVEPGFGPIDAQVASTVLAAGEALKAAGAVVEPVRLPVLEEIDATDIFYKLQMMEAKPAFQAVTKGHEADIFKYVKGVFDAPDTSMSDFVAAEQQSARLRDGFASYFQRFDALLCPVTPVTAYAHGAAEFDINGQTVSSLNIMKATVPLNVTGLPGLSMRFGMSREGLPINVQLVSRWLGESTILYLAALLERECSVLDRWPNILLWSNLSGHLDRWKIHHLRSNTWQQENGRHSIPA